MGIIQGLNSLKGGYIKIIITIFRSIIRVTKKGTKSLDSSSPGGVVGEPMLIA